MADWKAFVSGETEAQFRQFASYLFAQDSTGLASDGVLSGLAVAQQTSASKFVDVASGCGVVQDSTSNGVSPIVNGSVKAVDVLVTDVAESNPRNDLIVFDSATSTVRKIKGTANATPTDPTVPSTAVVLARVRVKSAATYAGTEVVATADIDDLRVYTTLGYAPTLNRVQITSTSDQTLSDNTVTVVNFSASPYDSAGMADLANNRVVIKKAGWYQFSVRAMFAFNATGTRALIIEKNSSTIVADVYASPTPSNTGSLGTVITYTTEPMLCAVNDNFRVKAYQSAGGTLPLTTLNGRRVVFTATQQVGS